MNVQTSMMNKISEFYIKKGSSCFVCFMVLHYCAKKTVIANQLRSWPTWWSYSSLDTGLLGLTVCRD